MALKVATFQERFNELLNISPKSRSAIADEFGVAKQTISAWATGQTSPRTPVASSLADYFDVSLPWLLGFDVPMERPVETKLSPDEHRLVTAYRGATDSAREIAMETLLNHQKEDTDIARMG